MSIFKVRFLWISDVLVACGCRELRMLVKLERLAASVEQETELHGGADARTVGSDDWRRVLDIDHRHRKAAQKN
jgi:hypothetical protein